MNRAKSTSRPLDRISGLPVSMLSHILSFLPTKDAVATHILSKSWSFVWTSVTNLDFSYIGGYKDTKFGEFVNFVNYVMLLHKPAYLNRLSLTLSEYDENIKVVDSWINVWICSAVANNVRELFVSCNTYKPSIHVETCMFTSERLESLELTCDICFSSQVTVSLPRLEHLKLTSFNFENGDGFKKLIDGCPVLKYLYIDTIMIHASVSITLSCTSLRHFEVHARYDCISLIHARFAPFAINLDAPSLEYIKFQACAGYVTFMQRSLTSLVEANFQPNILNRAFDHVLKAIRAFDCARALTLSTTAMDALSSMPTKFKLKTKFRRLTRLEVTLDWNRWSTLLELISLSDSLEVLTIKKGYPSCVGYLTKWKTPNSVPRCFSNSLKTISIGDYSGYDYELAMVAYTLKHASVLQLMQIHHDVSISNFKIKFEMVQKIAKFPRKSLCEVEIC